MTKQKASGPEARKAAARLWAAGAQGSKWRNKEAKALAVITLTDHIYLYLAEFDLFALRQAQRALNGKDYTDYLADVE